MKKINESFYEIKKSKFYGYLYQINDTKEIDIILDSLKKEHKKARHIVYAYKINNLEKKFEDKEPSNTAGTPILNLINIKNLNNICIFVVRYFGGTLLGRGPLTRSYLVTANELLTKDIIDQFFL
ncbi:MAG: YigZ family protein [Bacilli bacterium]|nr:YigZ family protein [Bacilli bacterium]